MIRLTAFALLLAACSDSTTQEPGDAAPDAMPIDGRPGPDAPTDAPGQPGPLEGSWSVTWTCLDVCVPEPELLRTQRLTVTGASLLWDSPACSECVVEHVGVARDSCVDVPAGLDNDLDAREAYSICATAASSLTATIAVRRVGGLPQVPRWRVDGTRQ